MNTAPKTARTIFLEAVEAHSPAEWPPFLDSECGDDLDLRHEVSRLLEAHQQRAGFMDRPAAIAATVDRRPGDYVGASIGPYKLLEQIGEGGWASSIWPSSSGLCGGWWR